MVRLFPRGRPVMAWMMSLCATSAALLTPVRRTHAPRMQAEKPKDWYYDNVEFMNEPFKFIAEHPDDFSEAMQAMADYHFMSREDSRPWNDLPMLWAEGAEFEQSLMQKSMQADDLAKVIMTADLPTMRELAGDAKFAEKKQLFQNLAELPPHDRGMLAIHDVISRMSAAGQLPALNAFDADVEMACQKVDQANAALRMLDEKYTTLFLAVRLTAKLSGAAAQMKAGRESAQPRQGEVVPTSPQGVQGGGGMASQQRGQGSAGLPPQQQVMPGTRPPFVTPLQPAVQGSPEQQAQQGLGAQEGLGGQQSGQRGRSRQGRYS